MAAVGGRGLRRFAAIFAGFALIAAPVAAWSQALPDTLRSAGVTVAQWDSITAEVHRVSGSLGISEKTLITVAQIAGLRTAKNGVVDVDKLIGRISDLATQVKALQDQLAALEKTNDTRTADLLRRAKTNIDAGDLDAADDILAQARQAAKAASTQAQLREAEVIATEAQVKSLRSDDLAAAELYAEAAETAPAAETHARWSYRNQQALALYKRGDVFGEPEPLRKAVWIYQTEALPLVPYDRAPEDWAATQNNLGIALLRLGEQGGDQALRDAISAFRSALEVRTRDRAPADWATTRNNLGIALERLGKGGDDQALRDAIAACRSALEVRTRDRAPADWATTQNNLGNALLTLGERGDDQSLKDAIFAYRSALEVFTRDRAPSQWALTQNNLGIALMVLGDRGDDQALKDGIVTLRGTLEVRTRDRAPAKWATTQKNLGDAFEAQGDKGGGRASYEAAVQCYKGALEVFTPESNATEHNRTQSSLDRVLKKLASAH